MGSPHEKGHFRGLSSALKSTESLLLCSSKRDHSIDNKSTSSVTARSQRDPWILNKGTTHDAAFPQNLWLLVILQLLLTTPQIGGIRRFFVRRATSSTRGATVKRTDIGVDTTCMVETAAVVRSTSSHIRGCRHCLAFETRMTACTSNETAKQPSQSECRFFRRLVALDLMSLWI